MNALPTSQTLSPVSPQNTNPFAKPASAPAAPQQFQPTGPAAASPLQSAPTGTNPFARRPGTNGASPSTGLMPQPTGTNPFRQSAFVNTATGMGWQANQMPIGGGLDSVQHVEVFPRPAQQQPWSQ